jgi:hypothetical protein
LRFWFRRFRFAHLFIERLFGGNKIIGQSAQNRGDIAGQHNRENGKEQAAPRLPKIQWAGDLCSKGENV